MRQADRRRAHLLEQAHGLAEVRNRLSVTPIYTHALRVRAFAAAKMTNMSCCHMVSALIF